VNGARADDDGSLGTADLEKMAQQGLAAAVTSSGKTVFALDDSFVVSDGGGPKAAEVAAALRTAASKAGARLIKHADDTAQPMLRVRLSALAVATAKETEVDFGLYIEVEAATRSVLTAGVTTLHKKGPGGKVAGHHTAATLDGLAARFATFYFEKPATQTVTIVGKADSNSVAQQCLIERITARLVSGRAGVVAAARGAVDVDRPKNTRLLGAQLALLVQLWLEQDLVLIQGSDIARRASAERFPYWDPKNGVGSGVAAAVAHMKKLGRSAEWQFRNDGYRIKRGGAKGKVWVLEARIEVGGGDDFKNEVTAAVRNELVGKEAPHWIFEAHDTGTSTDAAILAEAKNAGIDVLLVPILKPGAKAGRKLAVLELRTVEDGKTAVTEEATYVDESK
jgi:hypothetical protein